MTKDRQSTRTSLLTSTRNQEPRHDQKKQDWKLFLDLRLRLISGFKNLRKNFKIKIRWIIWFSYPFLTSGRLTQFLMRGVRWPGTVPLVLQTLRMQRSALQWLRQLSANFSPTLRQHACSQYKAKVIWWYTAGIFQLQDQSQRQNGKRKSLTSTKVQKPRKDFTR